MAERLHCCIPFCKRTTAKAEFDEWICGNHWRLIRQIRRRAYGRYMKRWRRYGDKTNGWRLWRTLVREATNKAMGI